MGRPLESLLKHYQLPKLSQRKWEQEKWWQNTDAHGLTHPLAAYLWILIPKLLKLRMELTLLLVYQTNNIAWIFWIVFHQKICNYKELLSSLHRLVELALLKVLPVFSNCQLLFCSLKGTISQENSSKFIFYVLMKNISENAENALCYWILRSGIFPFCLCRGGF